MNHNRILNLILGMALASLLSGCHHHGGFDWGALQGMLDKLSENIKSDDQTAAIDSLSGKLDGVISALGRLKDGDATEDVRGSIRAEIGAFVSQLNSVSSQGGAQNLAMAAVLKYMLNNRDKVAVFADPVVMPRVQTEIRDAVTYVGGNPGSMPF